MNPDIKTELDRARREQERLQKDIKSMLDAFVDECGIAKQGLERYGTFRNPFESCASIVFRVTNMSATLRQVEERVSILEWLRGREAERLVDETHTSGGCPDAS